MKLKEIISESEARTIEIGREVASILKGDELIPITGPLGAGKSVLVRGILWGLGYEGRVRSPSFTIERIYSTKIGDVHHWDLYRLQDIKEVEILFEEIWKQDGVKIIEWGERLDSFLPQDCLRIEIEFMRDENSRILRIDERLILNMENAK